MNSRGNAVVRRLDAAYAAVLRAAIESGASVWCGGEHKVLWVGDDEDNVGMYKAELERVRGDRTPGPG